MTKPTTSKERAAARVCVERGCDRLAQTEDDHREGGWSPYFCRECDDARIERITKNLEAIVKDWPKEGAR